MPRFEIDVVSRFTSEGLPQIVAETRAALQQLAREGAPRGGPEVTSLRRGIESQVQQATASTQLRDSRGRFTSRPDPEIARQLRAQVAAEFAAFGGGRERGEQDLAARLEKAVKRRIAANNKYAAVLEGLAQREGGVSSEVRRRGAGQRLRTEVLRAAPIDSDVDERIAREARRRQTTVGVRAGQNQFDVDRAAVADFEESLRRRAAVANASANQETAQGRRLVALDAARAEATEAATRALNQRRKADLDAAIKAGTIERGTLVQRAQASIANRSDLNAPRRPTDFRTGTGLLAGAALTSARFAISGALLYGAVTGIKELITEAEELETQLALLEGQFIAVGQAGDFEFAREGILGLARESGVAADQLAALQRQLNGVFRREGPQGEDLGIDTQAVKEATEVAAKLAQVTNLDLKQAADDLVGINISMGASFEEIADKAVGAENRTGVLAGELVQFASDLAPLAAELGFTTDQLIALGAAASQASGRGASTLSESIGRVLTTLSEKGPEIRKAFGDAGLNEVQAQLTTAFANNDIPQAIQLLIQNYSSLGQSQKNFIATQVLGRREAQNFIPILNNASTALRELNQAQGADSGALDQRFAQVSEKLGIALQRLGRAVEELGIKLFEAGLSDALTTLVDIGSILVTVLGALFSGFNFINETAGGIPGKIIGIIAAFKALQLVGLGINKLIPGIGVYLSSIKQAAVARGQIPGQIPGQLALPGIVPAPTRFARGAGIARAGGAAALGAVGGFPGLAVAGGIVAFSALFDRAEEQRRKLEEEILNELKDASDEELQKLIDKRTTGVGRFASKVLEVLPGDSGIRRTNFEEDVRADSAQDEVQRRGAPRLQQAIQIAVDEQNRIADELEASGDVEGAELQRVYSEETLNKLRDFIADPTNDPLFSWAEDTYAQILERFPQVADLIAKQQEVDALTERIATQTIELDTAEALFQGGRGSYLDVIKAYEASLKLKRDNLEAIKANEESTAQEVAAAEAEALEEELKLEEFITNTAVERSGLASRIRDLTGTNTPQVRASAAEQLLAVPGLSQDAQLDAVEQLIEANRDALQERLDNAETAAERLAILEGPGFEIPQAARQVLVAAQIPVTDQFERVAELLGTTISEAGKRTADLIVNFSQGERDIQEAALQARLAEVEATARLNIPVLTPFLNAQRDKITGEILALREADTFKGEIPGTTGTLGDPAQVEAERKKAQEEADKERRANAEARLAIQQAQAEGDPVAIAQLGLRAAEISLEFATTEAEELQAEAQRITALNQLRKANENLAKKRIELLQAQTQDPVRQAQLGVDLANQSRQNARTPEESIQAEIDFANALQAFEDTQSDIQSAQIERMKALVSRDPLRSAHLDIDAADQAIRESDGIAERLRAEAAKIQAEDAYAQALQDIFQSYNNYLIAVAEAMGNSVEAARLGTEGIQKRLDEALADPATGEAEINDLQTELVRSKARERDTKLQVGRDNIEFALEFERITVEQAIAQLTALLDIANPEQQRDILRRIKALREQAGADAAFNIGEIRLPTLYEVRRLNQTQEMGVGYNDSRTITINFTANNTPESEAIASQIVDGFARPSRFSSGVRRY